MNELSSYRAITSGVGSAAPCPLPSPTDSLPTLPSAPGHSSQHLAGGTRLAMASPTAVVVPLPRVARGRGKLAGTAGLWLLPPSWTVANHGGMIVVTAPCNYTRLAPRGHLRPLRQLRQLKVQVEGHFVSALR